MVLVQYVYTVAFQRNQSGYASAVAVGIYVVIVLLSVLQWQAMRLQERAMNALLAKRLDVVGMLCRC